MILGRDITTKVHVLSSLKLIVVDKIQYNVYHFADCACPNQCISSSFVLSKNEITSTAYLK